MSTTSTPILYASRFLRVALAAGFLSAVADRFGLWGPAGTQSVAWGSFQPFLAYTGEMLFYVPASLIPVFGWLATISEIVLAIGLLVGFKLRQVAYASGALLTLFAVAMSIAFGVEAPLSYSVWAAAAGGYLLGAVSEEPSDV